MSNYEQMELNITLDGERELKENVMLSVEFAYDHSSKAMICQTLLTDMKDTESRPTCGHSWPQKKKA